MSNEYKDYLYDCAQDYLLDNNFLTKIEYTIIWHNGYLIVGQCGPNVKKCYFVWQNDDASWDCYQIMV